MLKGNLKNQIFAFMHFLSLLFSFLLSELYFFSAKGVDFPKYKIYLEYFQDNIEQTSENPGLFYYYINHLVILLKQSSLTSLNRDLFLNSTIQTTNIIFYIFGVVGLYKLLRNYKYTPTVIFTSLSVLHFVPKMIEMRVLMKPEIIVFSFLPWVIIGLERYFNHGDRKSLFFSIFPLSLLLTSKPAIAGMVGIFLLIKFSHKINKSTFRENLSILFLFLILCLGLGFENYSANQISPFDTQVKEGDSLNNTADIAFLTTVNIRDLYYAPELGGHNNSFIGITLFDTFGDYYKVNLKNDDNYFTYYQVNLFSEKEDSSGFRYGEFFRNYIELILAILFYLAILITLLQNKKISYFAASPLVGMFILLLNSFGFIGKNFDPTKGDTVKVSYYGFFIAISFVFMLCEAIKKLPLLGNIISIILMISFLFTLGFPKSDYKTINNNLNEKVIISSVCMPLSLLLNEVDTSDCNNIVKQTCEYNLLANDARNILEPDVPEGYTIVYRGDSPGGEIVKNERVKEFIEDAGYSLTPVNNGKVYLNNENWLLLEKDEEITKVTEIEQCSEYVAQGFTTTNEINFNINNLPFLNLLIGILSFLYIIFITKTINKK